MNSFNLEQNLSNLHTLVIIAYASREKGMLEAFAKISKQCGCNISESKLTTIGGESTLIVSLSGSWNTIAKLEAALPPLAQQVGFTFEAKRSLPHTAAPALPYQVQVVAQDRPGIVNDLTSFFSQNRISIESMDCETYQTKNRTMMACISFLVNIPAKQHLANLRERFMVYCEDRNLDVVFEPHKAS